MSDHHHHPVDLPMSVLDDAAQGCLESRLLINRRHLLGLSAGLFTWAHLPRHAGAAGTEPRLLVVILRGGMDGLHVAVPLNDPNYVSMRGGIALAGSQLTTLTPEFALNANMPRFAEMFAKGEASLVHAIAPPLRIRSHFECQYNLEAGLPNVQARSSNTGWLNRLLSELPAGAAVKADALHMGATPLILSGPAPVLSWSPGVPGAPANVDTRMRELYSSTDPILSDLLERGLATNSLASGGTNPLNLTTAQLAFRGAARLLSQSDGPRIAVLDVDGWDTHSQQLSLLSTRVAVLDGLLNDFRTEIGTDWERTAVVCVTEMGRTARVNGSSGTDHGVGTVAFLLGGAIAGGHVWGDWPGLAAANLTDGQYLRATTDTRAVFKGLLADHLGVPRSILDTRVFPDSADVAPMQGLLKSPARSSAAASRAVSASTTAGAAADTALARYRAVNGAI